MAEIPATNTAKKIRVSLKHFLNFDYGGNIGKTPETPEQQNNEEKNDLEEDSE